MRPKTITMYLSWLVKLPTVRSRSSSGTSPRSRLANVGAVLGAIALLLVGVGCGQPEPRNAERPSARIVELQMLMDTVRVGADDLARAGVAAVLRTECEDGRAREGCRLEDETRWTVRDPEVARLYTHMRTGYAVQDTAFASFLPRDTGRTWIVVSSRNGQVEDSSLLVVGGGS